MPTRKAGPIKAGFFGIIDGVRLDLWVSVDWFEFGPDLDCNSEISLILLLGISEFQ